MTGAISGYSFKQCPHQLSGKILIGRINTSYWDISHSYVRCGFMAFKKSGYTDLIS